MNDMQKKKLVTETLIEIGADIGDNGFYILRDAVIKYMEYKLPASIHQKDIFTSIAEKYETNWKCAYRNVRFLIDKIMLYGDIELLESYFGMYYRPEKGSVRPKTFIMRIAEDVKMQCEKLSEEGSEETIKKQYKQPTSTSAITEKLDIILHTTHEILEILNFAGEKITSQLEQIKPYLKL